MTAARLAIGIGQPTNDLSFDANGSLIVVTDAAAVGQHVRQNLQTYYGEWFLDTSIGVPWLTQILGQRYDPALAEAVTKAAVLGTDGVTAITEFSVSFDRATRGVNVKSMEVMTEYDKVTTI
jgi:hypothetical protein